MLASFWHKVSGEVEKTSLLLVLAFLCLFLAVFWELGSVPSAMSLAEKTAVANSSSISAIVDWPINAPHKLLQTAFISLGQESSWFMRLPSAIFGALFTLCFYFILKNWFGRFIGILGTTLLVATPIFLILARNATPTIMLLAFLLPVTLYVASKKIKNKHLLNGLFIFLIGFALYSPGSVWVFLAMLAFWHKALLAQIKQESGKWVALYLTALLILVSPLIISAVDLNFLREWLFFPQYLPPVLEILKTIAWGPVSFLARTSHASEYLIGTVALLSLTQVVFLILGIVAMLRQARRQALQLAGLALVGLLLYSLNGRIVTLLMILPVAIIFAAAGLRYLYNEWKTVFPKNPIPKFVAVALLCAVCLQQFVYTLHYVHRAWPHTEQTKKIYVLK